jgi:hypothetical protein
MHPLGSGLSLACPGIPCALAYLGIARGELKPKLLFYINENGLMSLRLLSFKPSQIFVFRI